MNIKDAKIVDLKDVIFIKPDGELVYGEFHGDFARKFFGLKYDLTSKERLEGEERYRAYMEYKDQNWSINLVPFLIRFYGFDLHCYYSGTIISTKTIIYEYYFNYYLNGYTLEHESSLIRDEKTGLFTYQDTPIELIKENQA